MIILLVLTLQESASFIERCVRDVDGSAVRRDVAVHILKTCGVSALPALDKAGTPAATELAEEIRYPSPQVRSMRRKLRETKITLVQKGTLEEIIAAVQKKAGVAILIDSMLRETIDMTAATEVDWKDVPVPEAIGKLGLGMGVLDDASGIFVSTVAGATPAPLVGGAPLRLEVTPADFTKLDDAAVLAAPLAALDGLWKALDDADRAPRAAALLKRIYAYESRPRGEELASLRETRMSLEAIDLPADELLDQVRVKAGLRLVAGPCLEGAKVTIKVTDIAVGGLLRLAFGPRGVNLAVLDGTVVFGRPREIVRTFVPQGTVYWVNSEEADWLSEAVAGVAKDDARMREELRKLDAAESVPLLRYAAKALSGDAAARCARLADDIIAGSTAWFVDEAPSWAGTDGGEEGAAVRKALAEKRVSVTVRAYELSKTLKMMTEQTGVKFAAPDHGNAKVSIDVADMTLGRLLELIARPNGLKVAVSGSTVVIR